MTFAELQVGDRFSTSLRASANYTKLGRDRAFHTSGGLFTPPQRMLVYNVIPVVMKPELTLDQPVDS